MPVAATASTAISSGSSSQLQVGYTPAAIANPNTATSVAPRFISAVSTVLSGIARRGKRILRSRFSRLTTDVTEPVVASAKNWNSTSENRMQTP